VDLVSYIHQIAGFHQTNAKQAAFLHTFKLVFPHIPLT